VFCKKIVFSVLFIAAGICFAGEAQLNVSTIVVTAERAPLVLPETHSTVKIIDRKDIEDSRTF